MPAEPRAGGLLPDRDAPLEHVTPYDRFAWSDEQIERWLASGEYRSELRAYFGAEEYRRLAQLARRAQRVGVRAPDLTVCLVPGIMGSQLGLRRAAPLPHDIVWIDPIDIQLGRLALLRLAGASAVVPLGVMLFSYLRLKLSLRARGYRVECYAYDWRRSLSHLGPALASHLHSLPGRVALVAHSLGGLVARAALATAALPRIERVVLLGTPNLGSFAAVQALRGTYAVVRKVARLAPRASAESLTAEVFSSFASLYDLLPPPEDGGLDLFEAQSWPDTGPRPDAALLQQARQARGRLAPADPRFAAIAGVGQETVTALRRGAGGFRYTIRRAGDGTVPAASAALPGVPTYYARVAHSDLTRDVVVARAVDDLLAHGATVRLPARWHSRARASATLSDRDLARTHQHKVDWAALTPAARREFLQNLNEPLHVRLRVPRRG